MLSIYNYPSKLERYAVKPIGPHKFQGLQPLTKPSAVSRGVFGGNLCASAIVAAMEDAGPGFVPHSLHLYFVKAGDDSIVCQFDIERLNDGKSYKNRLVRASQGGDLKYIVMISLTKGKHSKKREALKRESAGKPYQVPVDSTFYKYKHEDLPIHKSFDYGGLLQHKLPPNFIDLDKKQLQKQPGERELSFWIRVGDDFRGALHSKFKYAGMGAISDSLFLSALSRILNLPYLAPDPMNPKVNIPAVSVNGGRNAYFFGVLLDHSVLFHDEHFEPRDWIFVTFKAPVFVNNRVTLHASYFDSNGKMFASVVQEGLVYFNEGKAKSKL